MGELWVVKKVHTVRVFANLEFCNVTKVGGWTVFTGARPIGLCPQGCERFTLGIEYDPTSTNDWNGFVPLMITRVDRGS